MWYHNSQNIVRLQFTFWKVDLVGLWPSELILHDCVIVAYCFDNLKENVWYIQESKAVNWVCELFLAYLIDCWKKRHITVSVDTMNQATDHQLADTRETGDGGVDRSVNHSWTLVSLQGFWLFFVFYWVGLGSSQRYSHFSLWKPWNASRTKQTHCLVCGSQHKCDRDSCLAI